MNQPMTNYGVDSMMSMELTTWASRELGLGITQLEVLGGLTAASLAKKGTQVCGERTGMCKNLFQLTVWHEIFAGSNFCDSYSDPQKKGAQINITANIFPAQFTPE